MSSLFLGSYHGWFYFISFLDLNLGVVLGYLYLSPYLYEYSSRSRGALFAKLRDKDWLWHTSEYFFTTHFLFFSPLPTSYPHPFSYRTLPVAPFHKLAHNPPPPACCWSQHGPPRYPRLRPYHPPCSSWREACAPGSSISSGPPRSGCAIQQIWKIINLLT